MISLLDGRVVEKSGDRVVLSVCGVGYDVFAPAPTLARLPAPGKDARLFTRLVVRDDSMTLFGFSSTDERSLFDHLLTVTGVGPKVALGVLSVLAPDALRRAVATGDVAALTLVPGVGKKVAGRIVLDLKDKVGAGGDGPLTGSLAETREALLALGLSAQEAREALVSLAPDGDRPVEELLREALRNVATGA
jgi:holliday junction DNA helicase RuvA